MKNLLLGLVLFLSSRSYANTSENIKDCEFELVVSLRKVISNEEIRLNILNRPGYKDSARLICSEKSNEIILSVKGRGGIYSIAQEVNCQDIQDILTKDKDEVLLELSSHPKELLDYRVNFKRQRRKFFVWPF